MGSSKDQIGERIHKYLIAVKWVTSVCCDVVLGFGRAGEHGRLSAQRGPGALRLFKSIYDKRLWVALCFITFVVGFVRSRGPKYMVRWLKSSLGSCPRRQNEHKLLM